MSFSDKAMCKKYREEEEFSSQTLCHYPVLTTRGMKTFGSLWVEQNDISRALVSQILGLELRKAAQNVPSGSLSAWGERCFPQC
jgi:hypothetical protein